MDNVLIDVSFLIPLYKSRIPSLKGSLESIYNQTYNGRIIIYCVLDGYSKQIEEFLLKFREKRRNFINRELKIIIKHHSGLSSSLNFGLDQIKEEYVFRQDDDDVSMQKG